MGFLEGITYAFSLNSDPLRSIRVSSVAQESLSLNARVGGWAGWAGGLHPPSRIWGVAISSLG